MKKTFFSFICLIVIQEQLLAQTPLPSAQVQTLKGTAFNTANITNNGKPIILFFWATYCKQSHNAFTNISENYVDWQEETGVKVVAVSIDDPRSQSKVESMVNSKGWEFEFYIDQNQDFKRAMSVNQCPHIFLIDNNGNIVWQTTGYFEGQEIDMYEKIKKLANGQTIE